MIDFHSHILPKADHGSDNLVTSLKMVKKAKLAGVSTIVATPHFYMNSDNIEDFLKRREVAFDELIAGMKESGLELNIIKGCEVNLQVDLFNIKDVRKLCIEGTNYMLLEMPMNVNWTPWHYDAIDELISLGIEPVIAHINRYSTYYLKKLFEKDILFQINVEAFTDFSSRMRMMKFFKKGYVDIVGSDIHHFSMDAYDNFKKYKEKYPKFFKTSELTALRILNTIKR